jgi:hypothetical protein
MTPYLTANYVVASQITSMVGVDTICWDLLPDNSGEHAGEPSPSVPGTWLLRASRRLGRCDLRV